MKEQLEHFVSPIIKLSLLSIIAFLTVVLVATHAALPPQIYWKSMLPNTPMPELIEDLLPSIVPDPEVPRYGAWSTRKQVSTREERRLKKLRSQVTDAMSRCVVALYIEQR
ncbi:hypothetical protein K1719_046621 [Acacia pycnantha]|nr:hypothetical protein K1719_046621 [Acacia pycnantha]